MWYRAEVVAGIFAVIVSACGSGARGGSGGSGFVVAEGEEPIESLPADQVAAFCARAVRCKDVATISGCVKASYPLVSSRVVEDVQNGIISYDPRLGFRCIQFLANTPCRSPVDRTSCHNAFKGTLASGVACSLDADCASDTCAMGSTGACPQQCCPPGTCADGAEVRNIPVSASCLLGGRCVEGAVCSQSGVCTALVAESGACYHKTCAPGLDCEPHFDPNATCVRLAKTGESCIGHLCEFTNAKCEAPDFVCRGPGDVGAACDGPEGCGLEYACVNGACALPGELGQTCVGNHGDVPCQQVNTFDTLTYLLECDASGLCAHPASDAQRLPCASP